MARYVRGDFSKTIYGLLWINALVLLILSLLGVVQP